MKNLTKKELDVKIAKVFDYIYESIKRAKHEIKMTENCIVKYGWIVTIGPYHTGCAVDDGKGGIKTGVASTNNPSLFDKENAEIFLGCDFFNGNKDKLEVKMVGRRQYWEAVLEESLTMLNDCKEAAYKAHGIVN